ncbi:hypothetical protein BHM03_00024221 [Ensete ventricosum]|nr:hypothetical protein BHM03_00024221 [Ensete ventricosum]
MLPSSTDAIIAANLPLTFPLSSAAFSPCNYSHHCYYFPLPDATIAIIASDRLIYCFAHCHLPPLLPVCSLPLSLPSPTPSWETPLLPSFAIVVANALPSFTYTATSGTYHHHQFRSHSQVTFYIDSTTFQPWTLVNP